jgi:hypothetical protein
MLNPSRVLAGAYATARPAKVPAGTRGGSTNRQGSVRCANSSMTLEGSNVNSPGSQSGENRSKHGHDPGRVEHELPRIAIRGKAGRASAMYWSLRGSCEPRPHFEMCPNRSLQERGEFPPKEDELKIISIVCQIDTCSTLTCLRGALSFQERGSADLQKRSARGELARPLACGIRSASIPYAAPASSSMTDKRRQNQSTLRCAGVGSAVN